MATREQKIKFAIKRFKGFWNQFKRSKRGILGVVVIVFFIIMAVFAPVIAPYQPIEPQYAVGEYQAKGLGKGLPIAEKLCVPVWYKYLPWVHRGITNITETFYVFTIVKLGAKMILYTPSYQDLNPENPLIFNETGIWTIEIQTNSSTSICKYKGAIWNFNEDSQVRNFFGNRIGIEVLSPTAVQQLATSIETKNLVEWQKLMVFVTAVMVCITAIAMAVNAITYKKVIKEIAKHLIKIEKIMEKLNKRGE